MDKVLVTGGSGLVGRTLRDILPDAVYLSSSEYDLRSEEAVRQMYVDHRPDAVVHLAGRVAGIYDHLRYPVQYFEENLLMNTFVLRHARLSGVRKFIGMLSTCIYPDTVARYPMREEDLHEGPPTPTVFSYAYAKRSLAVQIEAYNKQYGLGYNYLVPCNLYGKYDKFDANHSHFLSDLMRKIAEADEEVVLFGTGRPIRQFMDAEDLAKVIAHYLRHDIRASVNVATPEVYSIREMAEIAVRACGKPHLRLRFDESKVDGQYRKDVAIDKLLQVMPGFTCKPLAQGIAETYAHLLDPRSQIRGVNVAYNVPKG